VAEIAPAAPATARFAFIQILRGVAAILVVWSHLSGFWLLSEGKTSFLQTRWERWIDAPFHLFQNGGHLGVVLFFLISGYIITHTSLREDRPTFVVRRVFRILPMLIVATAVAFGLYLLSLATHTKLIGISGGSVLHWLSSLVLFDGFLPGGRAMDVTWTLVVELIFYTMTFLVLGVSRNHPLRSVWIMLGIWAVLSVASLDLGPIHRSANSEVALYVGFLIVGRVIYLTQQKLIALIDAIVAGTLALVLYCLFIEVAEPGFLIAPGGYRGVEPIVTYLYALIVFLAMMRLAPARVVRPFTMLGDISYSLYLLHIPVGITVLNLLNSIGVPVDINVIVAILVSVGVAWLTHRFVELPMQRLARRIRPAARREQSSGQIH
jgi:peptidoglycan/LPS O-acetylase OafA/YrhL